MAALRSLKDSKSSPEKGKWYRLLSDHGDGVGMLTKSWHYTSASGEEYRDNPRQVYVLEIVEPATYGVGYCAEESVLCMWLNAPTPGRLTVHHLSFPLSQFAELVAAGEEPPEYADLKEQQGGDA